MDAEIAEGRVHRFPVSVQKTLKQADWKNTTILSGDLVEDVMRLKASDGPNLTIKVDRLPMPDEFSCPANVNLVVEFLSR